MGASGWQYRPDVELAFAEPRESALADGNYYHGLGTYSSMADHDQPTNDDFERFIKGPLELAFRGRSDG